MSHFKNRDIVSIDHFTTDELLYLLKKTTEFKKTRPKDLLKRKTVANLFFEPSTRTRTSFMQAAENLGMQRLGFGSSEVTSVKKNESIHNTLEMYKGYETDVIVIRHNLDGTARYAADLMDIPIINAGDGKHEHPTQTLLDLFTIQEIHGRLENLKIGLAGDLKYGRTIHSLIKALRRFDGNKFFLTHPESLRLPEEYEGNDLARITRIEESLKMCDIVYMTRVQLERIEDERERKEAVGTLQLRPEMFKGLEGKNPKMKVLHPLPINSEYPEIEKSVYRDERSRQFAHFFQQAANGLPVREVLLCAVLGKIGKDFTGESYKQRELSEKNSLEAITLRTDKQTKHDPEHHLKPVYNGTVIDHLPDGMAVKLYLALHLDDKFSRHRARIAEGLGSERMTTKDLLMIKDHRLNETELNTVAMLFPGVTINMVNQGQIVEKYKTQLPDKIKGLLECQNSKCISRNEREDAQSIFYTVKREPAAELKCHYCDTLHGYKMGNLKL